MIGPDLYGVLGRKVASHEGYEYSDALKAKGGTWDYESINHMIENPAAYVPGTKMAIFPGLPDAQERADVLLFLRTKTDNPPPLPEVTAAATPAPAGGETPGGAPAAPAAGDGAFMAALATADPKAGEADAGLCKVCHAFNKGGAAVVGPDLYGVVGRKIASVEGFNYTPALKAHEGDWTFEKLDAWLTNPATFAPGTMMAFPGIPDTKKRADVIAYLNANSDSPLPLPKAAAAPAEKAAETPAAPAPEAAAPSAETPAAPAPEAAPSAETPAAPAPEAQHLLRRRRRRLRQRQQHLLRRHRPRLRQRQHLLRRRRPRPGQRRHLPPKHQPPLPNLPRQARHLSNRTVAGDNTGGAARQQPRRPFCYDEGAAFLGNPGACAPHDR